MDEKKRILVVDDESPIAEMIAEFCQSFGFETKILNSGEDILNVIKSYLPHLITLDLLMPRVSGLEVLEQLKQDEATKSIPVIVISSIAGHSSVEDILKKSTNDVLAKPLQMKLLRAAIENILPQSK